MFPSQALGFLTTTKPGYLNVNLPGVAKVIRELVATENVNPHAREALEKARRIAAAKPDRIEMGYNKPTFGYVAKWLSEIGDEEAIRGLLAHADTYMNPTWEDGGLYYPRNDTLGDRGKLHLRRPLLGQRSHRLRAAQCARRPEEDVGSTVDGRRSRDTALRGRCLPGQRR